MTDDTLKKIDDDSLFFYNPTYAQSSHFEQVHKVQLTQQKSGDSVLKICGRDIKAVKILLSWVGKDNQS